MERADILTASAAFDRYEQIRHRLPKAEFPRTTQSCSGLLEVADEFDAFLLDSFGVLNVGETAIEGAVSCLAALKAAGKRIIILTNAASYTLETAVNRYRGLGFDVDASEVISSRQVAAKRLDAILLGGRWGALAVSEDRFEDFDADIDHWQGQDVDGFAFLSTSSLENGQLQALEDALRARSRPLIIANPDLVAPREGGLSLEPGFYAHAIADRLGSAPSFFGKPFDNAFMDAIARLSGIARHRIAMVGDTLHTDILGGAAAGVRTVLVRDHGLFAGLNSEAFVHRSSIVPDFACGSI